ncbi:hypothetical protein N5P37_004105 [Trichoderma harzianum]|nr:hypothetical protein N5P37_004105 [Trichoderma harzianum]
MPAIHPTSQLADAAMGGYCFPFFSTLGSQVHHSFSSTESSTPGMWFPQPHQVALSKVTLNKMQVDDLSSSEKKEERGLNKEQNDKNRGGKKARGGRADRRPES